MSQLSPNFSLEEFVYSQTAARLGINNMPEPHVIKRLEFTAARLEGVRRVTGCPIFISSGYRCLELNRAVGGVASSQHVRGEAVDIRCPGYGSPFFLAKLLEQNMKVLGIDQLVLEFDQWVHVSFVEKNPRGEALTVRYGTGYKPGILPLS